MSKAGINDDTIMDLIDSTHSVFYLSADDIIDMKNRRFSTGDQLYGQYDNMIDLF